MRNHAPEKMGSPTIPWATAVALINHNVDGLGGVDNGKRTAGNHYEENQGRHLGKSGGDSVEEIVKGYGVLLNGMEGSGNQNLSSRLIRGRVKLACGNHIG